MKILCRVLFLCLLLPSVAFGARQTIEGGTGILWSSERAKLNAMFEELYSWGNHASVGYITGYNETDPLFMAWNYDYNSLNNKPTILSGSDVLTLTNIVPYEPTADYHPATKAYVDANIGEGGGLTEYPGAGVVVSTGEDWGTSLTVGTGASNLVQLNASGELPAVSAANLTNFPTLNQSTSGTAANVSGTVAVANGGTGATTAADARTALGLVIGTNVQAYSANLSAIAEPSCTADQMLVHTGLAWACAAATVDTLEALDCAENQIAKWNGSSWACAADVDTTYSAGNGITISGGAISVNTSTIPTLNQNTTGTAANVTGTVAVENGGTGSTTAADARTALGLAIGTNVQAYDADLTTYAGITPSANIQAFLGAADYAAMKGQLDTDDMQTALGIAAGTAHLGTFTGTTITDSSTVKTALQELETSVETKTSASDTVTWTGDHTFQGTVNLPADVVFPSGSVGADALSISASDITGLFSGTGAFLKSDGTTGDADSVLAIADLTDWPEAVSVTEVGYLDGLSANIQSQLNAISAGAVSILATDPGTPTEGQAWVNTTDGKFKVASSTGVYSTAALTYAAWDTTPTAFSFTDVTDADLSTVYTSNAIEVEGINYPAAISASGGTYSINSTETFTGTAGTVALGDLVRARVTSSASNSTAVNATVTIGGVEDTYTVTTAPASGDTFCANHSTVLMCEDFDGSESCGVGDAINCNVTWTKSASYPDSLPTFDYASAPASTGNLAMAIDYSPANSVVLSPSFAGAERWFAFKYGSDDLDAAAIPLLDFTNSDGTTIAYLQLRLTAGTLRFYYGGSYQLLTTSGTASDNTFYYAKVRIKYVDGAGNDEVQVWISTDGDWSSGTTWSTSTATLSAQPARMKVIGTTADNKFFDDMIISNSDIPNY